MVKELLTSTAVSIEQMQDLCSGWFRDLRDQICAKLEQVEEDLIFNPNNLPLGKFARKKWDRSEGGGGEMSVIKGRVIEKGGVNISTVHGLLPEVLKNEMPDGSKYTQFFATGISLVIHMQNPLVPPTHMNTRFIMLSNEDGEVKHWFGGGADLSPVFPIDEETNHFHQAFKDVCDKHDPEYYDKFKEWCDEYFFIKHRNESRGVGGIFYDYINTGDFDKDFAFTRDVGMAFRDIYPKLISRNINTPWSASQRKAQLIKRGKYAEFNLVYDRGTKFGFLTGGNTDAILMSLPPIAIWE